MKVFAIQTNQKNIPQFKQTNSTNQAPIMKTNLSGDKFVSKTTFGMATIGEMDKALARLEKRFETEHLSKGAREALADEIDSLKIKLEFENSEGGGTDSPADLAIKHYIP